MSTTHERARAAAEGIKKHVRYWGMVRGTQGTDIEEIIARHFAEQDDVIAKAREAVNAWKRYETDQGFKVVHAVRVAILDLCAALDRLDAAGKEKP